MTSRPTKPQKHMGINVVHKTQKKETQKPKPDIVLYNMFYYLFLKILLMKNLIFA